MNIEELFPEGQWFTEEEYVVRCPFCGDHPSHDHCYINVAKKVFCCHYCGEAGSLKSLMVKCEIRGKFEPRVGITEKKKREPTDFSQFSKITNHQSSTLNILAHTYLKNRGLSDSEMNIYDVRYSGSGRYYGRVLFPIIESRKVVNFVGRAFISGLKPKYLYPHTGETLITSNEAIFGYEEALNRYHHVAVMITEGVFDAIAANRIEGLRGLAVLSSHLSKGQLYKLLKLPKGLIHYVCLDSDAHEGTIKIARQLHNWEVKEIKAMFLKKGDPASVSKEQLIEAMKSAQPFSFNLELKVLTK